MTVAHCVGSWSGEGVNSRSILDGVRNETKGINAVKPVSNFFSVPSLLLWESPKAGMVGPSGAQQYGFLKMLSLRHFRSCTRRA